MRIAVLDIDGTMLPGSLGLRLLEVLRDRGLTPPGAIDSIFAAVRRHRAAELTFAEMVRETTRAYGAAICGLETAVVERLADEVWRERREALFPYVDAMLAALRRAGLRPVIVSSSPNEVVRLLAGGLGVPDATGAVYSAEAGVYTGACYLMPGSPDGKLRAIRHALALTELAGPIDLAGSLALGDSTSDACVLELVGAPIAFEPKGELRALAEARGWTVSDRARVLDDIDRALARARLDR